jgi:16S rRNA (cytosine967-C5)-methyltransferase
VEEIFTTTAHADKVLERVFKTQKKWGARDRRFVAESTYEIVRWWRYFGVLAGFDPTETELTRDHVWQIWAGWCFNTYHDLPDWSELKSFDRAGFEERRRQEYPVAIRESVPQWLYDYGREQIGPEWDLMLKSLNQTAEVFLRVNTLRTTRDELIRKLQFENVHVVEVDSVPTALRLAERKNLATTEAFKQGLFEVQDAASQMVAPLLKPESNTTVVDACAGGGGKTLHLAALMKNRGRLVGMDVNEGKLSKLLERAERNGVKMVSTKLISPEVLESFHGKADRLLLDVPCSGLGVLRRNPDTKWKLSRTEIQRLQQLQAEILENYSKMVKPGGMMVYATCSVIPAENECQIQAFLAKHGQDWKLAEEIRFAPHKQGFDGFYGARLERKA